MISDFVLLFLNWRASSFNSGLYQMILRLENPLTPLKRGSLIPLYRPPQALSSLLFLEHDKLALCRIKV